VKKRWIVFPVALAIITGLMIFGCKSDDSGEKKAKDADYTLDRGDGTENKADTTLITLRFTKNGADFVVPVNGLVLADISAVPGTTGEITLVNLSNSEGPTRVLTVNVVKQGEVKIKVSKKGFVAAEKTVIVYKKLGFQEDNSVTIANVVNLGKTPTAGSSLSFARYDGDPVAVLTPDSTSPITSISAGSPAFEHVLATFSPPLDLTDNADNANGKLLWFDMVWEGFGGEYTFANESTAGTYTGTRYDLHNVVFQLVLTASDSTTIIFQQTSETQSDPPNPNIKKPVRFALPDQNDDWGTGHEIVEIALLVTGMQLRNPTNNMGAWCAINSDRNPVIEDTYISSLTMFFAPPPPPLVLYKEGDGWDAKIENPKWQYGDPVDASDNDASSEIVFDEAQDGRKNVIYWNPIDITQIDTAQYSSIFVSHSGGVWWAGAGTLWLDEGTDVYNDDNRGSVAWGEASSYGSGGDTLFIPISNNLNKEKFIGIWIQTNFNPAEEFTITEIRLE